MPLDYLGLQGQIKKFSADTFSYHEHIQTRTWQAMDVLHSLAEKPEKAYEIGKTLSGRFALPTEEDPAGTFSKPPLKQPCNILSVDGSQIAPDAHAFLLYALLNIGVFRFSANPSQPIEPITISKLYQHKELFSKNTLISEDLLNLDRDVLEMKYLAEYGALMESPSIALRDGLLELYHEPHHEKEFQERFSAYIEFMRNCADKNLIIAGYVDKPRSNPLVSLLDAIESRKNNLTGGSSLFPDLLDRHIFAEILAPGQRSAIYENHSPTTYPKDVQLFFFYLNVSQTEKPWIVRVEIPIWVKNDPQKVNLLHTTLLDQCAIMGAKPYPYCLHRAHKTAVVRHVDKEELENQIFSGYIQNGIHLDAKSHKQAAKDLASRKNMEKK